MTKPKPKVVKKETCPDCLGRGWYQTPDYGCHFLSETQVCATCRGMGVVLDEGKAHDAAVIRRLIRSHKGET
jgi:DnaJ-class molecular chaperone